MGRQRTTRKKPWAWLFTVIILAIIVSACSNAKQASLPKTGQYPYSVSIMAPLHFPNPPSSDLVAEIEKQTETELDIQWIPDGIYTDKMSAALATNSLKKVAFVKYTDYNFVKNSIRSDAFWEIGPYLKDYPNLRHLDANILNQTAIDGKIYGLYTMRPSSRQGIILRQDWLDRLGLEKPDTIEELYEVIRQFTYGDPDGNGASDTVGLTDRNDLIFGAFKTLSSYFGTPNNWGVVNNRLVPDFETPEYMDTMNFMKKLYDEGLINRDFAVTSKDVQRNMIIRGKAGVYIGSMTDVQRLSDEAQALNPAARFTLVNRIQGDDGYRVWSIPNYNGLFLFDKRAIRTEEELKGILRFFDRTMDADVANLMRYGLQDRHYTLENGKVRLPEESADLRVEEVNPLYTLMIADLSNPNIMEIAQNEPLTALAEELCQDNEKFLVEDPTIRLESGTYDEKWVELYTIITDATYNYMIGNITQDGFYREVEKWKLNGGERIMKEFNDAYARQ